MNNYENQDLFSYKSEDNPKPAKKNKGFHFSYSKFSLYKECPLKYKFKYIDGIKEKPKPFFFFGRTIHSVLEYFFSRVPPPSFEELADFFKKEWEKENFEQKGYIKPEYEKLDFNKGLNLIKNFHYKHQNNDKIPFQLEYSTYVDIDGITAQIIADKIEYEGNGNITIVDYKTGKPGERTTEQLFFYQKICEADNLILSKIEDKYGEKLNSVKVKGMVYYYVESLKEIKFGRANDTEINYFWEDVLKTVENIRSEKFDPTPSERSCGYCDFKPLCPIYKNNSNSKIETLSNDYLKLINAIKELENKKNEIESEILKLINDQIEIIKTNSAVKIKKIKTYEFKNRDEIIQILKENNLYEKVLRPTIQAITELMEDEQINEEIKQKIKEKAKINYKLTIEEQDKSK